MNRQAATDALVESVAYKMALRPTDSEFGGLTRDELELLEAAISVLQPRKNQLRNVRWHAVVTAFHSVDCSSMDGDDLATYDRLYAGMCDIANRYGKEFPGE